MSNRPSLPEIITVNSEQLQTVIRDLLPSQSGFGSELQATNVITPIIDLTPAAEGSGLRSDLQTAIAFGSQTAFSAVNETVTLTSGVGWYHVTGSATATGAFGTSAYFSMTDGLATKTIWQITSDGTSAFATFDLIVGVATGITLNAIAGPNCVNGGSFRQIADAQGALVNPVGLPL